MNISTRFSSVAVITALAVFSISAFFVSAPRAFAVDPAPTCNGLTATIYIDGSNNIVSTIPADNGDPYTGTLTGTSGDDVIVGTSGNDIISANSGVNTICALAGDDEVTSGGSADWVDAAEGDNEVSVGNGDNTVTAGDGTNDIATGGNEDTITVGNGNNTISAGNGDNVIVAGDGNNDITTGGNEDDITVGDGNNVMTLGNGGNDVTTGNGNNDITGGGNVDTITTGAGNDVIATANGNDAIDGGAGYDFCDDGSGTDVVTNCEVEGNTEGIIIAKEASPQGSQSFSFTGTGSIGSFSLTNDGVTANYTSFNPSNTTYTVEETVPSGWELTSIVCTDPSGGTTTDLGDGEAVIDFDNNEAIVCIFTNEQIGPPTLTVIKEVVTDNGGTAVAGDWTLTVSSSNGGTGTGSAAGSESGTVYTLEAGKQYSVAESDGPGGYTESSSGSCTIASAVAGTSYTCTITNDDQAGTLIVKKVVVNDNGGTAATSTFSFQVNGGTAVAFESDGQNDLTVDAGTYSVTESATGYNTAYDNCSDVSIANGGTATCTITNDDIAPTLTLVKSAVTDGDPAETPPDGTEWTLTATGDPTIISGASGSEEVTSATVSAGSYTLSESGGVAHYAQNGGWNCSGVSGQDGTVITLAPGDTAICTVTNVYVPPGTIVIEKAAVGGDETFSFSGDLGDFSILTVDGGGSQSFADLEPGTFSVTEGTQPTGWTATSASCTDGETSYDPSSITLDSGATVVCTFTDTKNGRIIVEKTTDPAGEEQSFDFTIDDDGEFSLSDGQSNDTDYTLTPNTSYNISESVPDGWVQASATCDNGDSPSEVSPAAGQTVTCTFENGKLPTLTVVKNTDSGTGSFQLNVTGGEEGTQSLTLQNEEGEELSQTITLDGTGTFNVTENAQSGWKLADVSCEYDGDSVGSSIEGGKEITVDYGDHVTCTFVNTERSVIYVNKTVINDNNGTATSSDFSFQLEDNGEAVGGSVAFSADGGDYVIVDSGDGNTYDITEPTADGYTTTYEGCADIVLGATESTTCTITNDDVAAPPPVDHPPGGGGGIFQGTITVPGSNTGGEVLGASTSTVGTTGEVLGAATSTPPTCSALITIIPLAQGRPNNPAQVRALQAFLNVEMGSGLPMTGFFGPLTNAAVRTFQLKYWQDVLAPWVPFGLPTDHTTTGWVGKTSVWKINALYCPTLGVPFPIIP